MERPVLMLVCGLPGAGKTTLAGALAVDRAAARLCPDDWLVSLGFDLWDLQARDRLDALLWRHAQDLLAVGAGVVLESGFWTKAERDAKRLVARAMGAVVELHVVDAPLDVLWHRLERRNAEAPPGRRRFTRPELVAWAALFEMPDAEERALFDPGPPRSTVE